VSSDDLIPWLRLLRLPGVGSRGRIALIRRFGSIEAIFSATRAQLTQVIDGAPEAVATLLGDMNRSVFEPDLAWLDQDNCHLLTWFDADYPSLLREIPDPPVVLYVHGDRRLLGRPQVAIVGSRNPTPGGMENAQAFAGALARAGLVITSGLALGIDGAAHRGALAVGGPTIAIAGTGLDRIYPPRHRELAHEIASRGALISEYAIGTPPRAENFPIRNRLISGLSVGTLVIEAALQSGSLITARLAVEQGREVFAVPGSIHSPLARGCHALIREGAKLVETANDVIEELGPLAQVAHESSPASKESVDATRLEASLATFLEFLDYDPVTVDRLVERSGLTPDVVSSMLLQLELRGFVTANVGGTFVRV
jgi:DNA processing protein